MLATRVILAQTVVLQFYEIHDGVCGVGQLHAGIITRRSGGSARRSVFWGSITGFLQPSAKLREARHLQLESLAAVEAGEAHQELVEIGQIPS